MVTPLSMQTSDADLLARSRAGHAGAYGTLVARHQALVWRAAFRATGDMTLSEDLVQEAFLAAWKRLDQLREPAHFASWVCGIARNLAHYTRRHQRRHAPGEGGDTGEHALRAIANDDPSPLEYAIARQRHHLVTAALIRMPETYRRPLTLFYREHRSIAQVATQLGLSPQTVKQRLSRGRKLLQRTVAELMGRAPGVRCMVVAAIVASAGRAAAAGPVVAAHGAASGVLAGLAGAAIVALLACAVLGTVAPPLGDPQTVVQVARPTVAAPSPAPTVNEPSPAVGPGPVVAPLLVGPSRLPRPRFGRSPVAGTTHASDERISVTGTVALGHPVIERLTAPEPVATPSVSDHRSVEQSIGRAVQPSLSRHELSSGRPSGRAIDADALVISQPDIRLRILDSAAGL
ncbi:MAG: sigma-70 family RNA polymerase sigma factor [Myxococcota bacterium]